MSEGFFHNWVKKRMGSKRNILLAVVGETGVGKSYAAMRIGEMFDVNRDFDVSHVVFTPQEFFDALGRLKNNCFLVFDEAGMGFSHREFQSSINKMLAMVFQTFRYKYINVVFTLPSLGFMDFVGRSLLHGVIRIVDRGEGILYRVRKNFLGTEIYYPREGQLKFDLPSKSLIEAYEKKKSEVLDRIYESFRLESKERVVKWRYAPILDIVKYVKEHEDEFVSNGSIDPILVSAKLGIGTTKAYMVKRLYESVKV